MATEVYGCSDDLIEFEGEFRAEATAADGPGTLIMLSDGTVLEIEYSKRVGGVWAIDVLRKGKLFDRIEVCTDPDAARYSDTVYLKDGVVWAYVATEWEGVK